MRAKRRPSARECWLPLCYAAKNVLLANSQRAAFGLSQVGLLFWMLTSLEPGSVTGWAEPFPFALATFLIALAVEGLLVLLLWALLPHATIRSLANMGHMDQVESRGASTGLTAPKWVNQMAKPKSITGDRTTSASSLGSLTQNRPFGCGPASSYEESTRESSEQSVLVHSSALDHFYESMREHGGVDFSVAQLTYKLESMRSRPSWQVALRAYNISISFLEVGWAILFIVYAEFYAERSICYYNLPCTAECDPWLPTRVPTTMFAAEAVFLWIATIEYAIVCCSVLSYKELLRVEHILKLLQVPVGVLLWRGAVIPGFQPLLRPWGARAATPLFVSLQMGYLHIAQLITSKAIRRLVHCFVRNISQVGFVTTIARAACVVLFFAGLMQWLISAAIVCYTNPAPYIDWFVHASGQIYYDDYQCPSWFDRWGASDVPFLYRYRQNVLASDAGNTTELYDCTIASFLHYTDYLYFSVVTASTVGYGDLSPPTGAARIVTAIFIICIVAYVPAVISEAVEMFDRQREFCVGKVPSPWQDFVVLVGPISPSQLSVFIHGFGTLRGAAEARTQFVILSPLELGVYVELVSESQKSSSLAGRIYIQRGDILSSIASINGRHALPVDLQAAKAIFLFSSTLDSDKSSSQHEDCAAVARTLVLRKLVSDSLMSRVSLQLNCAREKRLALDLGVNAAISLDELKMGLLALSATRCFGLTTLLSNLLYTCPYEVAAQQQLSWRAEYLFGASHELYQTILPASCAKYAWREVVGAVHTALGVTLLAKVITRSTAEPGFTADGGGPASERREHRRVFSRKLESAHSSQTDVKWRLDLDAWSDEVVGTSCLVVALACSRSHLDMIGGLSDSDMRSHVLAFREKVKGFESASYSHIHQRWKNELHAERRRDEHRFATLERWKRMAECSPAAGGGQAGESEHPVPGQGVAETRQNSTRHMSPESILIGSSDRIGPTVCSRPFVLCICPSWPFEIDTLLSTIVASGDFSAVILCHEHPSDEQLSRLTLYSSATNEPLVKVVIGDVLERGELTRAGLADAHSVVVLSSFGSSEAVEEAVDEGDRRSALIRAKIDELQALQPGRCTAPVITEVHSAQAVRFLDPTLWWPSNSSNDFNYVDAPAYASGRCFSASMLHPLIGYTYFMPLLMPLLQCIIDVTDIKQLSRSNLTPDMGRQGIQLWPVPTRFIRRYFEDLFICMQMQGLTIIGLLRCPAAGGNCPHPFTFCSPLQRTVIEEGDCVYVLLPSDATQTGPPAGGCPDAAPQPVEPAPRPPQASTRGASSQAHTGKPELLQQTRSDFASVRASACEEQMSHFQGAIRASLAMRRKQKGSIRLLGVLQQLQEQRSAEASRSAAPAPVESCTTCPSIHDPALMHISSQASCMASEQIPLSSCQQATSRQSSAEPALGAAEVEMELGGCVSTNAPLRSDSRA